MAITGASLDAVTFGGLINEDVMQKIWDISSIPLPLTDAIGSDRHERSYNEWTTDKLAAPDLANKHIDGADTTADNTKVGARVGNHSQLSLKGVKVSSRAQASDVVGQSNALAYQVSERQKELRRDIEAIMLTGQASVADNGSSTAGQSAGLSAWIKTNGVFGATGAIPGFSTSTGLVGAVTPGTVRALSETLIRDACEKVYLAGGNPTKLMTVPSLVRKLSEYLFTSSARIATLTSETGQSREAATAKGAVNVFLTDFGVTLDIVPNRLQPLEQTGTGATVFVVDPGMASLSLLRGYQTEPLAKTGTSDRRQMSCDWSLKVYNEEAHAQIRDCDIAAAVVA
jgi:hypothetical protein